MPVHVAEAARLIKVIEAIIAELDRQGVAGVLADHAFDPTALAKAAIAAADGEVVQLPPRLHGPLGL